jgi:2-dehydro-3-deoxyphosphooctonate aldolase (KDO 8-P synthase)
MARFGAPVVFDATHSVMKPGGGGDKSSGDRTMVPYLARAAVAVGCAAVFMEVHQDPDNAPSDGPNMLKLKDLPALLEDLMAIDRIAKKIN